MSTRPSSRQSDNDRAVLNSDLHIQVVLKAVSHARNITDVRFDGGAAAWPMAPGTDFELERGVLKAALERAGVEFTNGKHAGVRVR